MEEKLYCVEDCVLEHFANSKPQCKCIIRISEQNLHNYSKQDVLIITQDCKINTSKWRGLIVFI